LVNGSTVVLGAKALAAGITKIVTNGVGTYTITNPNPTTVTVTEDGDTVTNLGTGTLTVDLVTGTTANFTTGAATGNYIINNDVTTATITASGSSGTLNINHAEIANSGSLAITAGTGNVTVTGLGTTDKAVVTGLATSAQTFTGLTAAGVTFGFDVTATTGAQTIVTGSGADTVTGGTGADTINVGSGADIVVIAAGDSVPTFTGATTVGVVSGIDNVTGFTLGTGSANSDELQVPGTGAIGVIGDFATNGTDSTLQLNTGAAVQTHAIASGILTVDDASSFGTAVTLTTTGDVAAVLQYLNTNDIGDAGDTLAFVATISTVPHTYVYTQTTGNAGGDAIDLVGVTATSLLITTNATTLGALFIS
jgi:hypothetical protein